MTTPSWQMRQPVGSPDGFKTQQEYDAAWKDLGDLNRELGLNPGTSPRIPTRQQQPMPSQQKAPNMSAYSPQTSSRQSGATNMSAYANQSPRPSNTAFADAWNSAMEQRGNGVRYTPATSVVGGGQGNLAYMPPDQRPAPFTMQAYDMQGNPTSLQGQQQQRDAFISQLVNAPSTTQQYDFPGMIDKANDMVQSGWTNPFSNPGSIDQLLGNLGRQSAPSAMYQQQQGQSPPTPPDQYDQWLSSLPGFQTREQWSLKKPAPTPQQYEEPPQPQGLRYTPNTGQRDSSGFDLERSRSAQNFLRQLVEANPNTWSDAQWADYKQAQQDTQLADAGGYIRQKDGSVRFNPGLVPPDSPLKNKFVSPNATRDKWGTWIVDPLPTSPPPAPPAVTPGQAHPKQEPSVGTPYPSTPKPPTLPVTAPAAPKPAAPPVPVQFLGGSRISNLGPRPKTEEEIANQKRAVADAAAARKRDRKAEAYLKQNRQGKYGGNSSSKKIGFR